MNNFNQKSAPSLTDICQNLIIRYTHHVIWRRVDPPVATSHECFKPTNLKLSCPLPGIVPLEEKNPKVFREHFADLRNYFSENLVRSVFDGLSTAATKFVMENRLRAGDLLLSLVFQDQLSPCLQVTAKHIVYRRWTIREERTLHRTLEISEQITKLSLPGKANDRVLQLVAEHCPLLEELDIATSYITDKGLYAICGVELEVDVAGEGASFREIKVSEQKGAICKETGKFVRAAKHKAKQNIDKIKNDPNFLKDMALGSSAIKLLKQKFSLLTARMAPFIDKRLNSDLESTWIPREGFRYSFCKSGCRKLKKLDLNRTNYPKRSIDSRGDVIVDLGLTREPVLCALLLLQDLRILKWSELGEIFQLFEMIFQETGIQTPQLNLNFLCDSRLTVDKLEVARRLCPNISRLDISMFNFSFDEQEFLIGVANDEVNPLEDKFGRSSSMFFDFQGLRDLEVQYLDDSRAFNACINKYAGNLTRICFSKMISISFETLASIKVNCRSLTVLEVFVDGIYTFDDKSTLEQVIDETPNIYWTSLKSLKLGGLISTGSVLRYLLYGCDSIRVLCYSLYEEQGDLVTDQYIEQLLQSNPMQSLVAFYFEKCVLSEQTMFRLLDTLPNLRFVGILSEWYGLDSRGRTAIKAFINGNNINVDVDSVCDNYDNGYMGQVW